MPMPRASVATAAAVKPRCRSRSRAPYVRSWTICIAARRHPPPPGSVPRAAAAGAELQTARSRSTAVCGRWSRPAPRHHRRRDRARGVAPLAADVGECRRDLGVGEDRSERRHQADGSFLAVQHDADGDAGGAEGQLRSDEASARGSRVRRRRADGTRRRATGTPRGRPRTAVVLPPSTAARRPRPPACPATPRARAPPRHASRSRRCPAPPAR